MNVNFKINTPGADHIKVKMVENAFPFGGMVDKFMPEEMPNTYRDFFQVFNLAVLRNEMKWYHNENQQDKPNYQWGDFWLELCEEMGVPLRGHAVFWSVDKHVQQWVKDIARVRN